MDSLIFGIRPLMEAVEAGKTPEKVFIQQGLQGDNFLRLFHLIRQKKIPFQMVPVEKLNRLTRGNHQGVVANFPLIDYQPLDGLLPMVYEAGEAPLLVLLDGITDVRNLGALARSAECAGVHAIVLPEKGVAPISADAIKASAGALARVPVCKESSIPECMAFLKASGIQVIGLDERGKKSIYELDLKKPSAFVMGSEEKGISSAVLKMADEVAAIPMKGKIASLNVSVAAGIVFFETLRQRDHHKS